MSQPSTETCKIRILDRDYAINCKPEEREILKKSAEFLSKRVNETRIAGVKGGEKIIVMTALNIVHDYLSNEIITSEETDDSEKTTKKLKQINKKIKVALHKHQQIELT